METPPVPFSKCSRSYHRLRGKMSSASCIPKIFKCCWCLQEFPDLRVAWKHQFENHSDEIIRKQIEKELRSERGSSLPLEPILRCKVCSRIFVGLDPFCRHKITDHLEALVEQCFERHFNGVGESSDVNPTVEPSTRSVTRQMDTVENRDIGDMDDVTAALVGIVSKRNRTKTVLFQHDPAKDQMSINLKKPEPASSKKIPAMPVNIRKSDRKIAKRITYNFQCRYCVRKFSRRTKVMEHESANHSNLKLYLCHVCGYQTSWKSELDTHLRNHETTRPYSCNLCGAGFKSASNRAQHRKRCGA